MQTSSTKSIMMVAGPVAMAALVVLLIPGAAIINTTANFAEKVGPHGYVDIVVSRGGETIYEWHDHNLITNAGKDFIALQLGSTTPGSNGANYIALTTDSTAPAATDTTLTSEISTGGLSRAQGTYSHTASAGSFQLQKTFTATASHTNVQKAGLFTASSSGTMMAETTFTPVTLANGDTLTITWTVSY